VTVNTRVRPHRTALGVAAVVLVASALLIVPTFLGNAKPQRFCETGLHITTLNGETVAYEDQGSPGRDDCDGTTNSGGPQNHTLGFDCKIRNNAGAVVATTTPNRVDGDCGQPDE